jgi:hypothetical protein
LTISPPPPPTVVGCRSYLKTELVHLQFRLKPSAINTANMDILCSPVAILCLSLLFSFFFPYSNSLFYNKTQYGSSLLFLFKKKSADSFKAVIFIPQT